MNKMESKKSFDEEAVSELLKNLEKEKAPENFEYNLMVRIQNKNFGSAVKDVKSSLLWIFVPSASVVAAAVVVLVFLFNGIGNETPVNQPKVIKNKSAQTYVVLNHAKNSVNNKADGIDMVKILKTKNDVVINKSVKIPVDKRKSLPLDKFLSNGTAPANSNSATLVSEETTPFRFDGFFPYREVKEKAQKPAARDSVKGKIKLKK
jgi:hypothetical protein